MGEVLVQEFTKDYVEDFLNISFNRGNTVHTYQTAIKKYFAVRHTAHITLEMIKKVSVKSAMEFLKELDREGLKGSITVYKSALTKFFDYMIGVYREKEYVTFNPFRDYLVINLIKNLVPRKSNLPHGDFLDFKEVDLILDYAKNNNMRNYLLFKTLYKCALRREELGNIRFNDFKYIDNVWFLEIRESISKNKEPRLLQVSNDLVDELNSYYHPLEIGKSKLKIFDLTGDAVNKIVKKLCRETGISETKHISAHQIRHTTCTHLHMKEVPNDDIQDFMGHADGKTTKKYNHFVRRIKHNAGAYL